MIPNEFSVKRSKKKLPSKESVRNFLSFNYSSFRSTQCERVNKDIKETKFEGVCNKSELKKKVSRENKSQNT